MPGQKRTFDVFSPPPSHSARFRSDHLDEIHAFIAAYDGDHRQAVLSPGPLGYSVHAAMAFAPTLQWSADWPPRLMPLAEVVSRTGIFGQTGGNARPRA